VAATVSPAYSDSGLAASTSYSYRISAYDGAGNNSAQSAAVSASTISGTTSGVTVRVYESAEDGTARRWDIPDPYPAGASVSNVFDAVRNSRVIKLSGTGTSNAYRLLKGDLTNWNHPSLSVLEWSMRFNENFNIIVNVATTVGDRTLVYNAGNTNSASGQFIYTGLGAAAKDGTWRTFVRDLQTDLRRVHPGATVTMVKAFKVRGSGKLDDVKLRSN
jgi:hypothetical protein